MGHAYVILWTGQSKEETSTKAVAAFKSSRAAKAKMAELKRMEVSRWKDVATPHIHIEFIPFY